MEFSAVFMVTIKDSCVIVKTFRLQKDLDVWVLV